MLKFCAEFFAAYCVLYFCGYSLKALFVRGSLGKYDLYITPWLGYGLIIIVLMPLSWAGFSVLDTAHPLLYTIAAANAIILLKTREKVRFEVREAIFIFCVGFILAAFFGFILSFSKDESFALTMNSDLVSYLADANSALVSSGRFLLGNPVGVPNVPISKLSLNIDLRGVVFVVSFLASIFEIDLARIIYPFQVFGLFMSLMTFRLFLGNTKYLRVGGIFIATLCFNSFMQWLMFASFIGQAYSIGITNIAVYLGFRLAESPRLDLKTDVLLLVMLTTAGLSYLEGVVYPMAPLLAYGAVALVRRNANDRAYIKNMAYVCIFYAVTNFYVLFCLFRVLMYVEASNPGWPMPLATFFDAAGLMNTFSSKIASIIFMIVSNVLLLETVLRQIKREGQKSFLSVCFVNCLLLYLVFCAWYFRPDEASSYNPYKAAVSMSYISFILIMRFLDEHLNSSPAQPGKIGKYVVTAVFAVFSLLSLLGSYNYVSGIASDMKTPRTDVPDATPLLLTNAHEELRAAGADPRNENANFYVNSDSRFNHLIAGYYLPFGRTYNLGKNGGGYGDRPAKETIPFKEGDILVSSTNFPEIYSDENMPELFSNKIYTLSSVKEDSILLYDFDGLGRRVFKINSDTHEGPVTAREIIASSATMHFMTTRERTVDFACAFYLPGEDIREKITAALYVNGLYAGALNTDAAYAVSTIRGLRLEMGINELKILIGGMSFEVQDDRFLPTPYPEDDDYAALAEIAFN